MVVCEWYFLIYDLLLIIESVNWFDWYISHKSILLKNFLKSYESLSRWMNMCHEYHRKRYIILLTFPRKHWIAIGCTETGQIDCTLACFGNFHQIKMSTHNNPILEWNIKKQKGYLLKPWVDYHETKWLSLEAIWLPPWKQ